MFNKLLYLAIVGLVSALPTQDQPGPDPITLLEIPYKDAFPCDLTVGGDGNIYSYDPVAQRMIRVNTASDVVAAFAIEDMGPVPPPSSLPVYNGKPYLPCAVRTRPNGLVYAVDGYSEDVIIFNPKTLREENFPVPVNAALSDILPTAGPIYYTATNVSKILAQSNGKIKSYTIPGTNSKTQPLGLYQTSDGDIWFTTTTGRSVGNINPQTKSAADYALPDSSCLPAYVRAEIGSTLYFTCFNDNAIIALDTETNAISIISTKGTPSQETLDGSGTLWWSSTSQTLLTSYNPSGSDTEYFQLPPAKVVNKYPGFTSMVGVQYESSSNRIYFVQQKTNHIGYVQLSTGQ